MREEIEYFEKGEYHELVNGMNDAVFIHNLEGNFLAVNNEAVNRLGYSREELLELRPQDIDALGYSDKVKDRIRDIEENETLVFESVHVTKSGKEIPVEINSSLITYQGEPAVLSVARDITERKEVEEELRESERKLRRTFEASPDPVFLLDDDGVFVDVNETALQILGFEKEEIVGSSLWNAPFFPDETVEKTTERFERRKEGEEIPPYPVELETKEGERIITEVNVGKLEEDGFEGEIVIGRDITDWKEAKERIEMAMNAGEIAFWDWDMKEDKLEFDEKWEEMIGYDLDELGEDMSVWKDLIHPDDIEMVEEELERYLNGETELYEAIPRMETKDGEWRYFVDAGKVVEWDENDNPKRFIGILRDVTDRMETEQRKDFLNTLLRQDLGSKYQTIQGYLKLLEEADLSEEYEKYLKKAIKSGREADEILGLAKKLDEIEETEWAAEKDIVTVLKHVIEDISDLVEREGVEIEENYPEEISKVEGDYSLNTLFKQTLMTRIQVGECKRMRINASDREEDILLKIEDDGKQLPEDVKNLFSGDVYTGKTTGVGGVRYYMLGEIATQNEAEIEVKDSELGGSRFNIYLQKA